jgi:NAD(P)-dependent dehydrogenase (short-subunit alcohol dehydrogenase family)
MSEKKEQDGRSGGREGGREVDRSSRAVLAELFDLRGTVALVTGGGSGLGAAMASVLVECGARVVVADREQDRLDRVATALATAGHLEVARVDVADRAAVDGLVDDIVARHGRIDAVFANAGIARGAGPGDPSGRLDTFDMADWTALLDVNLYGVLNTLRAAARHMKRQRGGSIVVTASTAGLRADPLVSYSYVVAKAGVVNLTRQAALDLARWRVRVNAIAPGPFRTAIGGEGPLDPQQEAMWASMVPLGRMGDPREIRGLTVLLASPASSFMTGGVYPVDGGQLLQAPGLPEP